jgi:integrase
MCWNGSGTSMGTSRSPPLERRHLEAMVATKAMNTPGGAAVTFLATVRALLRHAVAGGLREDDPTIGLRRPRTKSTGGWYSWSEDDIARFESHHPIGSRARLALALLLYTAQRRSDVIRMGRQHIRNTDDGPVIQVRQQKTAAPLEIPIHPELQVVIDGTPAEHLTFLVTRSGGPFNPVRSRTGSRTAAGKRACRPGPRCTGCARRRAGGWRKSAARPRSSPQSPATPAWPRSPATSRRQISCAWPGWG